MQPLREVYSLLMPLNNGRVILPRAAIAEVTGYTRPKERPEDAPEFVLGFIEWQGQRIPLISFEAARGQPVPELGRRTRIAVLFGIAERLTPNVFAVVTQGYPYLVRVNENVLKPEQMDVDEPLVLARVRMANEKPYIPNLEQLEVLIAEGLGVHGQQAEESQVEQHDPVDELDGAGGEEDDFGSVLADEGNGELSDEPVSESDASEVDLDEVTAFGEETNYSAELGELSNALDENEKAPPETEEADDLAVDLSELELDEDGNSNRSAPSGDDEEIDFSDLEIDFEDEGESKDKGE